MDAKHKAELAYITGEAVVESDGLPEVMNELDKYNEHFYTDIEMEGLVLIYKA